MLRKKQIHLHVPGRSAAEAAWQTLRHFAANHAGNGRAGGLIPRNGPPERRNCSEARCRLIGNEKSIAIQFHKELGKSPCKPSRRGIVSG